MSSFSESSSDFAQEIAMLSPAEFTQLLTGKALNAFQTAVINHQPALAQISEHERIVQSLRREILLLRKNNEPLFAGEEHWRTEYYKLCDQMNYSDNDSPVLGGDRV